MNRKKWLLIFILAALLLCCPAAFAAESGRCGDLMWTLNDEGLLIISGNGAMSDFSSESTEAWLLHRESIQTVQVSEGVTSVGHAAFLGCSSLTDVDLADSVTSIAGRAFFGCSALCNIQISDNVT